MRVQGEYFLRKEMKILVIICQSGEVSVAPYVHVRDL
jgi:hypothetical protein